MGLSPTGSLLFFCAPSLHGQMGSNYYGWGMEAQGSFSDCRGPLKLHLDGGKFGFLRGPFLQAGNSGLKSGWETVAAVRGVSSGTRRIVRVLC